MNTYGSFIFINDCKDLHASITYIILLLLYSLVMYDVVAHDSSFIHILFDLICFFCICYWWLYLYTHILIIWSSYWGTIHNFRGFRIKRGPLGSRAESLLTPP